MAEPLKLRSVEDIQADIDVRLEELKILRREMKLVEDYNAIYKPDDKSKA